jgi:hypothetical protein
LTPQIQADIVVQAFLHGPQERIGRGPQIRLKCCVLDMSLIGGNRREKRYSGQEFQNQHGDNETPCDGSVF